MELHHINPLVLATEAPPIPIAQAWRGPCYKGEHGPLIDLSQAVPGHPPPKEPARQVGRGGEASRRRPLRAHRRRSPPLREALAGGDLRALRLSGTRSRKWQSRPAATKPSSLPPNPREGRRRGHPALALVFQP